MHRSLVTALALAAGLAVLPAVATAQMPPPERPGRYTLQPVEGGVLRLDTETGAVSLCTRRPDGVSCDPVKDEASNLRAEVDRLKTENRELRAEIDRLHGTGPEAKPGERKGGQLTIPSEKDLDDAMDTLERLYKKFRDRIKRLESDQKGGTPL